MIDLFNEILATLRFNKLRTALTGFAVSWGIFLLIVLLAVSNGLVNGVTGMFSQRDKEVMSITGGWAQKPYKGLKDERSITLKESDTELLESRNGNIVAYAVPELSNDSVVISTQKDYLTGGYKGVYPQSQRSDGTTMEEGRYINDNDIEQGRRVIVLHRENANTLFGVGEPAVGKFVRVGDLSFTVVGIYFHEWMRSSIIPYTTAKALAGGSENIRRMQVKAKGLSTVEDANEAENEFRSTLGNVHSFDPTDDSALWIWNRFRDFATTNTALSTLTLAVWIIGLLTLLSGIVGVSNIMFVSVRERTHEIGVRRAIGARPVAILRQIILESVAITTLFGYVGIVLGVIVTQLIAHFTLSPGPQGHPPIFKDPSVDLSIALQVTVVLVITGCLAGLFPALKSLKIKPVEALRDE
ncbi:MAG: ABC transporter permease [Duncaniella sp.]|nr:ABC transporter permease [Duncaniella sp.]